MAQFDETKQEQKVSELHEQEAEELAQVLSEKYGVEYVNLSEVPVNTNALRLIDEERAREVGIAGFKKTGSEIALAAASPDKDAVQAVVNDLEERGYDVTLYIASKPSLEKAWERYQDLSYAVESEAGVLDISSESVRETIEQMDSLDTVQKEIRDVLGAEKSYRISRVLEIILSGGIALKASDVHLEPEEAAVRLRFRLDGVLMDVIDLDHETYELLLSRIKLLSGLKLNVSDAAQDGRFSIKLDQDEIEIRTSAIPGAYGESVVMRILNPATIRVPMEELGMEEALLDTMRREISRPNGMILNTGPTGSGKTTTLYAFLRTIHEPEVKIITIENPVEYHLEGIVQTQVKEESYSFLEGLRSALRQDPDVIMVGEIRDAEVAKTGINAALTGHLVFSTLHTNTAAGTFPRLIELGVDPKIIGSAVNVAMAQRLVRELCSECKKEIPLEGEAKEMVDAILSEVKSEEKLPENREVVWEATGCDACDNTGYQGRIGIFEAILVTKEIEELVRENPSERDIQEAARSQDILNMEQDGVIKALRGVTSLKELQRVIELRSSYERIKEEQQNIET